MLQNFIKYHKYEIYYKNLTQGDEQTGMKKSVIGLPMPVFLTIYLID